MEVWFYLRVAILDIWGFRRHDEQSRTNIIHKGNIMN
jgi:hypothetical protein